MEADGLRWSLLIIGSLVIVGLAVHGIWISRKNSEKKANANKDKIDQDYQPSGWQPEVDEFDDNINATTDDIDKGADVDSDSNKDNIAHAATNTESKEDDYDDLGLGSVRVVSSATNPIVNEDVTAQEVIKVEPDISSSKIYASVVTQPKPEFAEKLSTSVSKSASYQRQASSNNENKKAVSKSSSGSFSQSYGSKDNYQAPEPPPFLLKKETSQPKIESNIDTSIDERTKENYSTGAGQKNTQEGTNHNLSEKPSFSEKNSNLDNRKTTDSVNNRLEPKITDDQMRIDFDEQSTAKSDPKKELKAESAQLEQPQEVLVLNVKLPDNKLISGSALLPMLLTLGFKFGDQDIFHRHVNSNGKGPVLFSLANMFKPGNFDIDNLENFSTGGISLFMILPIEGEPHQVFNMMHNAARKIADEFSAQIYDGRRTLLSKQSLQQYVEKIREFERQRLIRG